MCQHLRVLKDVGLVVDRQQGTRRLYQVAPEGLALLRAHLDGDLHRVRDGVGAGAPVHGDLTGRRRLKAYEDAAAAMSETFERSDAWAGSLAAYAAAAP